VSQLLILSPWRATPLKILAFKGRSWVSKAIRFQTRSEFSHIGIQLDDGTIIEAWHKGGVQHVATASVLHTPGTEVHVYRIDADLNNAKAERFLLAQVGKKYDFKSIARFLSRRDSSADDKYFCSELAEYACLFAGVRLLNGRPSEHAPGHTVMSPLLILENTFRTV